MTLILKFSKAFLSFTMSLCRSIPVHCIVEQVTPQGQSVNISQAAVDLDSFAIIPSTTLFSEIVHTALNKLGYSSSAALTAKGAIQLKNWKPLTFDQITESPDATVGDILGELSSAATLRIRLYSRPKLHSANDVKEKLLQVLLAQSQNLLVSSGCPIDQVGLFTCYSGVMVRGESTLLGERVECSFPSNIPSSSPSLIPIWNHLVLSENEDLEENVSMHTFSLKIFSHSFRFEELNSAKAYLLSLYGNAFPTAATFSLFCL
ncbi:uncharacterized protein CDAR_87221 [Caerostris darwini]|uniref:CMP domain-containing protein n=1 Tax=Caerostris darwini TaxID=1538125 RepID=A0AAV4U7X4_9ARAC|nr:uncharacterized protein CDAR_87221 [Caerostris darwini]